MNFSEVRERIQAINGLVTIGEAECLFNLASKVPEGGTVIEIGSWTGMSSSSLGFGCSGFGRKLYCIDPWCYEPAFVEWKNHIQDFGLAGHVTPIQGWAGEILQDWKEKADLAFIDGNHEFHDTMKDFMLIYPFVKIGGMIAFHDVDHPMYPGVRQTWDAMKIFLDGHYSIESIYWGVKKLTR